MPAKCTKGMQRDALYKCYPEQIEVRPDANGRHDKPDIEWLIADILAHGQNQPVGIWDDGGQAVLSFGFSRWRAISEINKRGLLGKKIKMQIKCVYINTNEKGAFIRNISENRMRNPTTAIDDAHNIQRLFNLAMDEKDVARIYFPTAATEAELKDGVKWIQDTVKLVKLTPEAQAGVISGRINETAAQAIAKLSASQQKELLKSKEGKVTASDARAAQPKSQRAPKSAKPVAIDTELRRRITAVIESAPWETYDEGKTAHILVDAIALAALKNYTEEK